jgi:hypothetical protein
VDGIESGRLEVEGDVFGQGSGGEILGHR